MNVKLTDEHGQTFGGMQWGPGVTHGPTMGGNRPLCTSAWLHLYEGLGLAILHNPLGAAFSAPRFWRVSRDTRIERREGLKAGSRRITTTEEVRVTLPSAEQLMTVAILLAFDHYDPSDDDVQWGSWAVDWLSGENRSKAVAEETSEAANAAGAAAQAAWAAWAAVTETVVETVVKTVVETVVKTVGVGPTYLRHIDAVACAVFGF